MELFLGTHQNRLDAKGRVSVPASFRSVLRQDHQKTQHPIIFRPSHKFSCIEVWPSSVFTELTHSIEKLDPFSEEYDNITTTLYAEAWSIDLDKEGRVLLPDHLKEHANITDMATFMGLGTIFQIWEPSAAIERCKNARQNVQKTNISLTPQSIAKGCSK